MREEQNNRREDDCPVGKRWDTEVSGRDRRVRRSLTKNCGLPSAFAMRGAQIIHSGFVDSDLVDSEVMTRQQVLDLYFMDARCKLIEIAAFLDRVERASGNEDFRITEFRKAMRALEGGGSGRAEKMLLALSDPTKEPIPAATTKAACGAWVGEG